MFNFKKTFIFFVALISLAGYGYLAFAVINPGDTLDPVTSNPAECPTGPTDPTCIVTFPSGGSVNPINGLSLIGPDIGLGGQLTQSTVIDQDGNDFAITDGFFSFGKVNDISLGTSLLPPVPFVGSWYNDGVSSEYVSGYLNFMGSGIYVTGVKNTQFTNQFSLSDTNDGFKVDLEDTINNKTSDIFFGTNSLSLENNDNINGTSAGIFIDATNGIQFRSELGDYFFPKADGTIGQVLTTDGAGQLIWNSVSGGGSSPIEVGTSGDTLYSSALLAGQGDTILGKNVFLGIGTGVSASSAHNAIFIGSNSGRNATNASYSTFLGSNSGFGATNASGSIFLGHNSGESAANAANSNFLGSGAGFNATNATGSNFFGSGSGGNATDASYSTFIGINAGLVASNASYSTFIGANSGARDNMLGVGSQNTPNSIFIGRNANYTIAGAGLNNTTTNIVNGCHIYDCYSILFGNYSDTAGFSNSIAIGAYATNTASNQFMIGSPIRPISETVIVLDSIGGECIIDNGGANCSSDESLKSNIQPLDTTLETLRNIIPVTYTWNANNQSAIGFSAQNIQTYYPELVKEGSQGYLITNYANLVPILTKAIQELDVKLSIIESQTIAQGGSTFDLLFDSIRNWLGNIGNGIQKIFARQVVTNELCIEDICFTKDEAVQLRVLIDNGSVVIPESQIETEDNNIQDQDDDLQEIVSLEQETTEVEEIIIPEQENNESSNEPQIIPDESVVQE